MVAGSESVFLSHISHTDVSLSPSLSLSQINKHFNCFKEKVNCKTLDSNVRRTLLRSVDTKANSPERFLELDFQKKSDIPVLTTQCLCDHGQFMSPS